MAENISVSPVLELFPSASLGDRIKKFPLIFGCGLLVVFLALFFYVRLEQQKLMTAMENNEQEMLRVLHLGISRELQAIGGDLLELSHNQFLAEYLGRPSSFNKLLAMKRLKTFAWEKGVYSQVRYIDSFGNETIRINVKGATTEVVATQELQNKADRDYFREAIKIPVGRLYVSPLDLNMKKKEGERSIAPTMRIATPVVSDLGQVKGILVVNFRVHVLFNLFTKLFPKEDAGRFWMINAEGAWLKANQRIQWQSLIRGETRQFKEEYPELWKSMRDSGDGGIRLKQGIFSFTALYPSMQISPVSVENAERLCWHLLLFSPAQNYSLKEVAVQRLHLIWLLGLVLLLVAGASFHLASVLAVREKMQDALRLLATGIEQNPAAVVITDMQGHVRYANPKFSRMTGYDRKAIVGEHTRLFQSGATPTAVYRALWQTILAGKIWKGDFENRHKDGKPYHVSAQIAPILNKRGEIDSFLALQEDVTEKKRLQKELEAMATRDGLTGVNNRAQFMKLLQKEIQRSSRYGHALSILSFDIDLFKNINDTYGHHVGDVVLTRFAKKITAEMRDNDFIGRLGGEEFAAALVGTELGGARILAERVRWAVQEMEVECDGQLIQFTVSIGLTVWGPEDDTELILKRADKALYSAKKNGRNQVVCFEDKGEKGKMA